MPSLELKNSSGQDRPVPNPSRDLDFLKLFKIVSNAMKIKYDASAVEYLISKHYDSQERPFRNCHPRDLLLQIRNYCRYNEKPVQMTRECLDFAADNYFSVM